MVLVLEIETFLLLGIDLLSMAMERCSELIGAFPEPQWLGASPRRWHLLPSGGLTCT
jgi:hypothetical protein